MADITGKIRFETEVNFDPLDQAFADAQNKYKKLSEQLKKTAQELLKTTNPDQAMQLKQQISGIEKEMRDIEKTVKAASMEKSFKIAKQEAQSFTQKMDNLKSTFDDISAFSQKIFFPVQLFQQGAAAIGQVVNKINELVQANATAQKATNDYAASLKAAGIYSQETFESGISFAQQMQNTTAFEGDQIVQELSKFVQQGLSVEESQRRMGIAMDLAAKGGTDLSSAVNTLRNAEAGRLGGLEVLLDQETRNRLEQIANNESLSDAEKESQSLAITLQGLETSLDGTAEANSRLDGGVAQLTNAWGDLQETLGANLQPVVNEITGLFTNLTNRLNELIGRIGSQKSIWEDFFHALELGTESTAENVRNTKDLSRELGQQQAAMRQLGQITAQAITSGEGYNSVLEKAREISPELAGEIENLIDEEGNLTGTQEELVEALAKFNQAVVVPNLQELHERLAIAGDDLEDFSNNVRGALERTEEANIQASQEIITANEDIANAIMNQTGVGGAVLGRQVDIMADLIELQKEGKTNSEEWNELLEEYKDIEEVLSVYQESYNKGLVTREQLQEQLSDDLHTEEEVQRVLNGLEENRNKYYEKQSQTLGVSKGIYKEFVRLGGESLTNERERALVLKEAAESRIAALRAEIASYEQMLASRNIFVTIGTGAIQTAYQRLMNQLSQAQNDLANIHIPAATEATNNNTTATNNNTESVNNNNSVQEKRSGILDQLRNIYEESDEFIIHNNNLLSDNELRLYDINKRIDDQITLVDELRSGFTGYTTDAIKEGMGVWGYMNQQTRDWILELGESGLTITQIIDLIKTKLEEQRTLEISLLNTEVAIKETIDEKESERLRILDEKTQLMSEANRQAGLTLVDLNREISLLETVSNSERQRLQLEFERADKLQELTDNVNISQELRVQLETAINRLYDTRIQRLAEEQDDIDSLNRKLNERKTLELDLNKPGEHEVATGKLTPEAEARSGIEAGDYGSMYEARRGELELLRQEVDYEQQLQQIQIDYGNRANEIRNNNTLTNDQKEQLLKLERDIRKEQIRQLENQKELKKFSFSSLLFGDPGKQQANWSELQKSLSPFLETMGAQLTNTLAGVMNDLFSGKYVAWDKMLGDTIGAGIIGGLDVALPGLGTALSPIINSLSSGLFGLIETEAEKQQKRIKKLEKSIERMKADLEKAADIWDTITANSELHNLSMADLEIAFGKIITDEATRIEMQQQYNDLIAKAREQEILGNTERQKQYEQAAYDIELQLDGYDEYLDMQQAELEYRDKILHKRREELGLINDITGATAAGLRTIYLASWDVLQQQFTTENLQTFMADLDSALEAGVISWEEYAGYVEKIQNRAIQNDQNYADSMQKIKDTTLQRNKDWARMLELHRKGTSLTSEEIKEFDQLLYNFGIGLKYLRDEINLDDISVAINVLNDSTNSYNQTISNAANTADDLSNSMIAAADIAAILGGSYDKALEAQGNILANGTELIEQGKEMIDDDAILADGTNARAEYIRSKILPALQLQIDNAKELVGYYTNADGSLNEQTGDILQLQEAQMALNDLESKRVEYEQEAADLLAEQNDETDEMSAKTRALLRQREQLERLGQTSGYSPSIVGQISALTSQINASVPSFQTGGYTGIYEGLAYLHPYETIIPDNKLQQYTNTTNNNVNHNNSAAINININASGYGANEVANLVANDWTKNGVNRLDQAFKRVGFGISHLS